MSNSNSNTSPETVTLSGLWNAATEAGAGISKALKAAQAGANKACKGITASLPEILREANIVTRGLTPGKVSDALLAIIAPKDAPKASVALASKAIRRSLNILLKRDEDGSEFGMVPDGRGGNRRKPAEGEAKGEGEGEGGKLSANPSEVLAMSLRALSESSLPMDDQIRIISAALDAAGYGEAFKRSGRKPRTLHEAV